MTERTKGMLEMLTCALLWSVGGVFIKLVPWSGFAIAGARALVAGLTLLVYARIRGFRLRLSKETVFIAFSLAGTYLSFVCATKLTTAANAIVIQYTAPVYLLVFGAIFQGQKLKLADCLVVLFTVLGIGVFFLDQMGVGTLAGNLIALLSGVFFAAMFLTTSHVDEEERMSGILQGQLVTALIGLPFLFFEGSVVTTVSIGYILILGVIQIGIASMLYARALQSCPPLACSLLATLEPLLNPVWVLLFTGEKPGLLSLFGGIVVILSVTVWCIYNTRKDARQEPAL